MNETEQQLGDGLESMVSEDGGVSCSPPSGADSADLQVPGQPGSTSPVGVETRRGLRRYVVAAIVIIATFGGYKWFEHRRWIAEGEATLNQASSCISRGEFTQGLQLAQVVYQSHEASGLGTDAMRLIVVARDRLTFEARKARAAELKRLDEGIKSAANFLALEIKSTPAGATVVVNGKVVGQTPIVVDFTRDQELAVSLRLEGYEPVELAEKPTSGRYHFLLELQPTWKMNLRGTFTYPGTLTENRKALILTDRSGQVAVIDLVTKKVRFRKSSRDLSGDLGTPLVYDDFFVVVSRSGSVRALETKTGKQKWRLELPGPLLSNAARIGDHILVAAENGTISLLYRDDGAVINSIPLADRIVAYPVSDGRRFGYVLDTTGRCHKVGDTGRTIWSVEVPQAGTMPPVLCAGRLLIPTDDRRLRAIDARDGKELWTAKVGDALRILPAVIDDKIYVVTGNRQLLELRPRDGKRLRQMVLPESPSAPVSRIGGSLIVPVMRRGAYVIDPEHFEIDGHLADGLTSELPVIGINGHDLIFATNRGQLLGFRLE